MKYPILLLASAGLFFAASLQAGNCPEGGASYDIQQGSLVVPAVTVEKQGGIFAVQLDLLDSKNPFQFQLSQLDSLAETIEQRLGIFQSDKQILKIPSLCVLADNSELLVTQVEMQLIPNSSPLQFLLKSASDSTDSVIFNWAIGQNKGAVFLNNRQEFEELAAKNNLPGVTGVRELKFVITDLDSLHPVLYFMNSDATPLHYDFTRGVLKRYQNISYDQGSTQFIAETYFREERRYLAGSVVAYDEYRNADNGQEKGLYALEFWPTDPVPEKLIEHAYRSLTAAMPFLPNALAYHPVGNTHELEFAGFAEQFAAKNILSIDTDSLFAQLESAILNQGEAYGRLKVISPGDPNPGEDTIAIYTYIPNTLGHVGGIITEQPQTPLSHINLKARQNDTPNA